MMLYADAQTACSISVAVCYLFFLTLSTLKLGTMVQSCTESSCFVCIEPASDTQNGD